MAMDFSTITPYGVIALSIICLALLSVIFFLGRNLNNIKVSTEKVKIEAEKANNTTKGLQQKFDKVAESNLSMSKAILKKQSNLAKHHIEAWAAHFKDVFEDGLDLTDEEKQTIELLVEALIFELKYQIGNHFAENHIGETEQEIKYYTETRTREYMDFIYNFFYEHERYISRHKLKDAVEKISKDWLFDKLYEIFRDGKSLEKTIKEKG